MTKIYALKDPITLEIRYVGKTIGPLEKRLREHVHSSKKGKTHRDNWIRTLSQKPIIELIEVCEDSEWEIKEKYWIAYHKRRLTNHSEGGVGANGVHYSIEHRELMSKAREKPVLMLGYSGRPVERFPSIKEASKWTGLHASNIWQAIKRGAKGSAGSYRWMYEKDYDGTYIPYIKSKEASMRQITQYDLQMHLVKIWPSTTEAANTLNIKKVGITKAKCGALKTYKGFIWK